MEKHTMTFGQMAYLLDQYQLTVEDDHPLNRFRDQMLEKESIEMDEAFIRTIIDTESRITIRFGGGAKRTVEQTVFLGQLNIGLQISNEITLFKYKDPFEIVDQIIINHGNKSEIITKNILPSSCELDEFICLLNSIDMYRKCYYESMLGYKRNDVIKFTVQEYTDQLNDVVAGKDIRWLTPCFMLLVPNLPKVRMTDSSMLMIMEQNICSMMKHKETGEVSLHFTDEGQGLGLEFEKTWNDTIGFEFKNKQVTKKAFLAVTALANHFVTIDQKVNHQNFHYEQLNMKLTDMINEILV